MPDLPGLGESAFPPDGDDAMAVAQIVAHGIDIVLGPDTRYDVAGFSFGGTMATCVGAIHGARVRSVTIIGSSGVGPSGSAVELLKVRHLAGEERVETHRINLNRLMIADPAKIDDLALAIQEWNTRHSRLKTPTLSRSGALPQALAQVVAPVNGIWGELDAPANPRAPQRVVALRALRPDADVRMIAGCRPLGRVRGAGAVQCDAAGDAEAHPAVERPVIARQRSDAAIPIAVGNGMARLLSLRSQ